MFEFAYDKPIQHPIEDVSPENVEFYTGVFEVADKYNFPALEKEAPRIFGVWMVKVLDNMANEGHDKAVADLVQIVTAVYEFAERAGSTPEEAIVRALRDAIFGHERTNPMGETRTLGKLIEDTSLKVPELGAELYRGIMQRRAEVDREEGKAYLTIVVKVKCPVCNGEWFLDTENGELGHCWGCGTAKPGWQNFVVK